MNFLYKVVGLSFRDETLRSLDFWRDLRVEPLLLRIKHTS